jgi:RNA polymerase sigma-70 factor (ECF subfamily)
VAAQRGLARPFGLDVARDAVLDFDEFFAAHSRRLVGLVAASTGNPSLAEDVTQEAFIRALQRWERVSSLDRPDLWVLRVALNLATDARRVKSGQSVPLPEDLARSMDQIDRLWVEWGMSKLSPKQRAAMLLHHLEGRDLAEVAKMLGCSRETVKTHLSLARGRLRKLLSPGLT